MSKKKYKEWKEQKDRNEQDENFFSELEDHESHKELEGTYLNSKDQTLYDLTEESQPNNYKYGVFVTINNDPEKYREKEVLQEKVGTLGGVFPIGKPHKKQTKYTQRLKKIKNSQSIKNKLKKDRNINFNRVKFIFSDPYGRGFITTKDINREGTLTLKQDINLQIRYLVKKYPHRLLEIIWKEAEEGKDKYLFQMTTSCNKTKQFSKKFYFDNPDYCFAYYFRYLLNKCIKKGKITDSKILELLQITKKHLKSF